MKPANLVLVIAGIIVSGCDIVSSTYEPSPENLRDRLGDFIVPGAADLKPVYGNSDVNSVIATYCVQQSSSALIPELTRRAAGARWRTLHVDEQRLAFDRADGERYERVELRLPRRSRCLAIAYLQASEPDAQTFERSGEAAWAREELWPKLERAAR